jgi:hypothetical protein
MIRWEDNTKVGLKEIRWGGSELIWLSIETLADWSL